MDGISREKNGKQQDRDPLGKRLEPAQIDALINYVRTLKKEPPLTPGPPPASQGGETA